ncbi:replication endonuclease [Massilia rhizosphaerae]|uniref:replication endonuclease n=1 Tax=Massilia rhizosphaerae TaxID=2784389 RepID=UPI0018DE7C21|nr:replication endonuclease [Massilia rhizosphaerae]
MSHEYNHAVNQSKDRGDLGTNVNNAFSEKSNTRDGIAELLQRYKKNLESEIISRLYAGKYTAMDEIPPEISRRDHEELKKVGERISRSLLSVVASDGRIADYIEMSHFEIKQLAISLAELQYSSHTEKVNASKRLLGCDIPGDTFASQFSRCCSAAFWRRALSTRVARAKEQAFLRLGMLGTKLEKYVSDSSIDARELQLRKQQKWMSDTYLVPAKSDDAPEPRPDHKKIPLIDVVQEPKARFAKLYSFVKAMELLAEESKLNSAMLTITLESEWHPNPSHGIKKWNGKSPREAHQSFCKRWQAIVRDLHRRNIRLSGLRVVEPHGDACPHYHVWLLYRPEHEAKIMLAIMQYFPHRLKVATALRSADGKIIHEQSIYKSREHLVARSPEVCSIKARAQVVFSKINSDISKGASYATKYLMMTLPVNFKKGEINSDVKDNKNKSSKGLSLARVDSYRSVWGMSRGQLFGVAKCLTVWDHLRKMVCAPKNSKVRDLWAKARGGVDDGRIGKGAGKRGDAFAFLKALGGLDAARNGKQNAKRLALTRLVEQSTNRHGDRIEKTVGILLVEKKRMKVVSKSDKQDRPRSVWKTVTSIVASVRTKLKKWEFVTVQTAFVRKPCSP